MAQARNTRSKDVANRSMERTDYRAGANGTQHVDSSPAEHDGQLGPDEISEPDEVMKNNEAKVHLAAPDHSEREGGGDQDIGTAGVVPDDDAEDSRNGRGF